MKPSSELRPDNAWAEKAQEVLLTDPRLGATPQERRDKLLQGGLKVYTTEDPGLQQLADAGWRTGCRSATPGFAAAPRRDGPEDGLCEGHDRQPAVHKSKFNLATDGAGGQVGSSFKVTTPGHDPGERLLAQRPVDGTAPCSVPGFRGSTDNAAARARAASWTWTRPRRSR